MNANYVETKRKHLDEIKNALLEIQTIYKKQDFEESSNSFIEFSDTKHEEFCSYCLYPCFSPTLGYVQDVRNAGLHILERYCSPDCAERAGRVELANFFRLTYGHVINSGTPGATVNQNNERIIHPPVPVVHSILDDAYLCLSSSDRLDPVVRQKLYIIMNEPWLWHQPWAMSVFASTYFSLKNGEKTTIADVIKKHENDVWEGVLSQKRESGEIIKTRFFSPTQFVSWLKEISDTGAL